MTGQAILNTVGKLLGNLLREQEPPAVPVDLNDSADLSVSAERQMGEQVEPLTLEIEWEEAELMYATGALMGKYYYQIRAVLAPRRTAAA
ncbi:MAG: hypothetical protein AB1758_34280 [Candidatus Eremiobacterota bacterium]